MTSLGKRKYPFKGHSSKNADVEELIKSVQAKIHPEALKLFPPLIFLHQLYNQGFSRTWIDQQVHKKREAGILTAFKLRVEDDDLSDAVVFTNEISEFIKRNTKSTYIEKFVDDILPQIRDSCIEKDYLKKNFKLSDFFITELVQENILVIKDVGRFWLSFPKSGEFVKAYTIGRKHLLRYFQNSKYLETLQCELIKKGLPKKAVLGIAYHIQDLIGADDVESISTASGVAIRRKPS